MATQEQAVQGPGRGWARVIGGGLAGAFVLMLVEVPWHDAWFGGYYQSVPYIVRPEPDFTAPTIAFLFRGLIMSAVYPRVFRGGSPLREGLVFGIVVGLLTGLYWAPAYFAQQPIPAAGPWFLLEGAFFIVQGAAAGLAVALVHGRAANRQPTGEAPLEKKE